MEAIDDFRASLLNTEIDVIVDKWFLVPGAKHIGLTDIDYIQSKVASRYGIELDRTQVWITGSAKLGFSISEKRRSGEVILPRYRAFSENSDIDVAVVSSDIFYIIWRELSLYAHRQPKFPWDAGKLADYLIYGWLRPDHFPKVRLYRCDSWWDIFRSLSVDSRFHRRRVRGGLFQSVDQLRSYMGRAVTDCVNSERLK